MEALKAIKPPIVFVILCTFKKTGSVEVIILINISS
jgi:hypothetical protein